jgi:hypothetical protein
MALPIKNPFTPKLSNSPPTNISQFIDLRALDKYNNPDLSPLEKLKLKQQALNSLLDAVNSGYQIPQSTIDKLMSLGIIFNPADLTEDKLLDAIRTTVETEVKYVGERLGQAYREPQAVVNKAQKIVKSSLNIKEQIKALLKQDLGREIAASIATNPTAQAEVVKTLSDQADYIAEVAAYTLTKSDVTPQEAIVKSIESVAKVLPQVDKVINPTPIPAQTKHEQLQKSVEKVLNKPATKLPTQIQSPITIPETDSNDTHSAQTQLLESFGLNTQEAAEVIAAPDQTTQLNILSKSLPPAPLAETQPTIYTSTPPQITPTASEVQSRLQEVASKVVPPSQPPTSIAATLTAEVQTIKALTPPVKNLTIQQVKDSLRTEMSKALQEVGLPKDTAESRVANLFNPKSINPVTGTDFITASTVVSITQPNHSPGLIINTIKSQNPELSSHDISGLELAAQQFTDYHQNTFTKLTGKVRLPSPKPLELDAVKAFVTNPTTIPLLHNPKYSSEVGIHSLFALADTNALGNPLPPQDPLGNIDSFSATPLTSTIHQALSDPIFTPNLDNFFSVYPPTTEVGSALYQFSPPIISEPSVSLPPDFTHQNQGQGGFNVRDVKNLTDMFGSGETPGGPQPPGGGPNFLKNLGSKGSRLLKSGLGKGGELLKSGLNLLSKGGGLLTKGIFALGGAVSGSGGAVAAVFIILIILLIILVILVVSSISGTIPSNESAAGLDDITITKTVARVGSNQLPNSSISYTNDEFKSLPGDTRFTYTVTIDKKITGEVKIISLVDTVVAISASGSAVLYNPTEGNIYLNQTLSTDTPSISYGYTVNIPPDYKSGKYDDSSIQNNLEVGYTVIKDGKSNTYTISQSAQILIGNATTSDFVCGAKLIAEAKTINASLSRGFWQDYNNSSLYPEIFNESFYSSCPDPSYPGYKDDPSCPRPGPYDLFWCTFTITKSYARAGQKFPQSHLAVGNQIYYFKSINKYVLNNGKMPISQIAPGSAIFFGNNTFPTGSHVAMISAVTPDYVTVVESNTGYRTRKLTIISGIVQDTFKGGYVVGFGLPTCSQ